MKNEHEREMETIEAFPYWNRGGVGPSRALVPVFGHAEWALENSGLQDGKERRGVRDFC